MSAGEQWAGDRSRPEAELREGRVVSHLGQGLAVEDDRGEVVICDRYLDSTRAYQGHGRGRPLSLIEDLHKLPPLDRRPDRTILLDVPPVEGLTRASGRGAADQPGYDDEDVAFFDRVRRGFLAVAAAEPERVRVVDASGGVAATHAAVVAALRDLVPGIVPAALD